MNRFREIASVRLPGTRFRRRHMSPKGIRPGITWSRRWTVNLVTAGGARRAVAFINTLVSISNFEILKFSEKKYSPKLELKMFEKHPEVRKNENLSKKFSAHIWDFQVSMSAIYIRITARILHLQLELLIIPKNISKIKISFFQKLSAIDVWDYSFPEAKDHWEYF